MDRAALLRRYAGGVEAVVAALDGAGEGELDARPADGGWTARQVVHHLADSEARAMLRLRQLLAEPSPTIQAYDQDEWAARLPYDGPVEAPLAVVAAVRAFALATLDSLAPGDWDRAGRHPEHDDPYTVDAWLAIYAEHPYEHADQIAAARRGAAGSGSG